ncbi:MAG: 3-deoxy-D-manno-octulosonic acid transferase, partial [Desulfococcaceae bacterium]
DAERFASLFGSAGVTVMPNIKFDRIRIPENAAEEISPFQGNGAEVRPGLAPGNGNHPLTARNGWFKPEDSVVVLGSIREEEEPPVLWMVRKIRESVPNAILALAPRHLHRVSVWTDRLSAEGIPWALRSDLIPPASAGRIVIWNTFGELGKLYECADAVFVGGSLAPLGGQNFMEPLAAGRIPVIGPSWSNFAWIGEEIFRGGLAVRTGDAEEAANSLLSLLRHPPDRDQVREKVRKFVRSRSGGAKMAAEMAWRILFQDFIPYPN